MTDRLGEHDDAPTETVEETDADAGRPDAGGDVVEGDKTVFFGEPAPGTDPADDDAGDDADDDAAPDSASEDDAETSGEPTA